MGRTPVVLDLVLRTPDLQPTTSAAPVDDAPDELPAVGKVAADGATRSLWQAFKKSGVGGRESGVGKNADSRLATDDPRVTEPSHLATMRQQATERLIGRHAAMFDAARLVAYDDATGQAKLHFPHDAAAQATYVKRNRDAFALAFSETAGRPVSLELDVAPEESAGLDAPAVDDRPKVVRPSLDAVAAETRDEPVTPAVDVEAVKGDPLVAAVLRAFEGARIVKVE